MRPVPVFCACCNTIDDARSAAPQNQTGLIFGLALAPPPQPKPSSVTIVPADAQRIEELVRHVYGLGMRPMYEVICAVYGGGDPIQVLEEYRRLDRATVKLLGADRLPHRSCKRQRRVAA